MPNKSLASVLCWLALSGSMTPTFALPSKIGDLSGKECLSLLAEKRWDEIVAATNSLSSPGADLLYCRGMALARLGKTREASQILQQGAAAAPGETRFPLELAGIAFGNDDFGRAKVYLREALKSEPGHPYARDFLGTLHLLEENQEAALEVWNPIGKPVLSEVRLVPQPKLSPILTDRIVRAIPGETLRLEELLDTRAHLESFRFLSVAGTGLELDSADRFRLSFRLREEKGLLGGPTSALLSSARGLPFETLHLDFPNLDEAGLSVYSLLRWDENKRRIFLEADRHFVRSPGWSLRLAADVRDEQWQLESNWPSASQAFSLRRDDFALALRRFAGYRWNWSSGVRVSRRRYVPVQPESGSPGSGVSLHYAADSNQTLYSDPDTGVEVRSLLRGEVGRFFEERSRLIGSLQGGVAFSWLRKANWKFTTMLAGGSQFGEVPPDELFNIGMDRDNPYGLRAHLSTRNGRKGRGPLGKEFLLSRTELEKKLADFGLLQIRLSPFLDLGRTGTGGGAGENDWLIDAGVQLLLRVAGGASIVISWGRDLREGRSLWHFDSRESGGPLPSY